MITKILVVGYGRIAKRHLSIVRKLCPQAQIFLLRLTDSASNLDNIAYVSSNINDALKFRPNISIICSPAPSHLSIANSLLNIGSHLLIEKPISTCLAEAKLFANTVSHSDVVCHIGYNLRFHPSLLYLRSCIHDGMIGSIYNVRAQCGQYLPTWRPHIDYRESVTSSSKLGGGVINELSHEIDYLQWLFGKPLYVTAHSAHISHLELDVEDFSSITMTINNSSFSNEIIANITLDCFRHDGIRDCIVIGSNGTLRCSLQTGFVDLWNPRASSWSHLYNPSSDISSTYISQMNYFLECIRSADYSCDSVKDAICVLETIHAIKQSSDNLSIQTFLSHSSDKS